MWTTLKEDIQVVFDRDPAARNIWEILLTYPGFHAMFFYRMAHAVWLSGLKGVARFVSNVGRFLLPGLKSIPEQESAGGFLLITEWEWSSAKPPKSGTT